MNRTLLSLLFLTSTVLLIAQDECSTATALTPSAECTLVTYSNVGSTDSGTPDGDCGFYNDSDVWFTFTPTDGSFAIFTDQIGGSSPVVSLYSGVCGALIPIDCDSGESPFGSEGGLILDDASLAGQQLFFRVFMYNTGAQGDFDLCVVDTDAPINNYCANAISITPTATVDFVSYSNLYSSDSGEIENTCGFTQESDVWFTTVVPADGQVLIETSETGDYSPVLSVYEGTCGSLNLIECSSSGSLNGNSGQVLLNDASLAGETLYFRVLSYANVNGGDFSLTVVDVSSPANDLCENAQSITVEATETYTSQSNLYATESDDGNGGGGCGFYSGGDVWFSFTAPANGQFVVTTAETGDYSTVVELYTGLCGALSSFSCSTNGSSIGNSAQIIINDATLGGQTITARAYSYAQNNGGTFDLAVFEVNSPANDFCENAQSITVEASEIYTNHSNLYATASDDGNGNGGCGFYSGGDIWFSFTAPADGQFVVTTAESGDYSPVVELYTGVCGALSSFSCSTNGSSTGNSAQLIINDASVGGQLITLRAYSYADINGGSFGLAVFEVDSPTNDFCSNATPVSVAAGPSFTTYSNLYATDSDDGSPGCGFYAGGDIWFSFTSPADGQFVISTKESGPYSPSIALYSGSCGALNNIECSQNSSPADNSGQIIINDASLGGQQLFVRAFSYATINGGIFDLSVFEVDSPQNDFCANATPLTVNGSCSFTTYSNEYATDSDNSVIPNNNCGFNSRGDIWFTFTFPASNPVFIDTFISGEYSPVISLFTGTCDDLTLYDCDQSSSDNGFNGSLSISDASLVGETVYLRVVSYADRNGGDFDLCIFICGFDVNNDQIVDSADLVALLSSFGCVGPNCVDINGDNKTDSADLVALLSAFGTDCNN